MDNIVTTINYLMVIAIFSNEKHITSSNNKKNISHIWHHIISSYKTIWVTLEDFSQSWWSHVKGFHAEGIGTKQIIKSSFNLIFSLPTNCIEAHRMQHTTLKHQVDKQAPSLSRNLFHLMALNIKFAHLPHHQSRVLNSHDMQHNI
jgi:hypothetical protein